MSQKIDIKGFEGRYAITRDGIVISYRQGGREKKHVVTRKGYCRVSLFDGKKIRTFFVHRLVAEAFIGAKPSPEHEVNHVDFNRRNNAAENLQWVTPHQNRMHTLAAGRFKPISNAKVIPAHVSEIREILNRVPRPTIREVAERYGISKSAVKNITSFRTWRRAA